MNNTKNNDKPYTISGVVHLLKNRNYDRPRKNTKTKTRI